jgi:hypothetical protein
VKISPREKTRILTAIQAVCQGNPRYESGKCVELALALTRVLPGSSLAVGCRTWEEDGLEMENNLSHVIIIHQGEDFDSQGGNAQEAWEARWDNPPNPEEENIRFSWGTIGEKELLERRATLKEPATDWNLIHILVKALSRELGKNQKRESEEPEI